MKNEAELTEHAQKALQRISNMVEVLEDAAIQSVKDELPVQAEELNDYVIQLRQHLGSEAHPTQKLVSIVLAAGEVINRHSIYHNFKLANLASTLFDAATATLAIAYDRHP